MFAALLVCAATVLAAAAPGVALAAGDLATAQDRVAAAGAATRATVLAHTLADERDDLAVSVAAGRPALPGADRARTDGQVRDLTPDGSAEVRTALVSLPAVRTTALAATTAQAVIAAYQPLADTLGRATGPATAPLGRATAAAAVQRGLLVAALTAGGSQRTLVADAQAAHLQEQAALAEFRATAPADLRARYDQTVTGADTAQADHDLTRLLAGPQLTSADRDLGAGPVKSALTARIGLMRGVDASADTDAQATATAHRDHTVTVLELRSALAALCLILLVGVLVTLLRGLTRPLAALHRWSRADAESGQGAEVIGADEFAAVARRVNALTHEAQALRSRAQDITADRTASAAAHSALTAEHKALLYARSELLRTQDDLLRSRDEMAGRLAEATARNAAHITYVNLSLRTLGLVERQLALIEGLEEHEEEPARLETLFRLDHLATRMRRNSENLLVLTGTEHSHGAAARPVPLIDVARAAISEIERYERVSVQAVPEAQVAGRAADDVSHLIAELLDNAAAFSAPTEPVLLSGWVMETGEVMLSVEDTGIGVPPERLDELNELLADPDPAPPGPVSGMGLYVVARLAHRHGVRTQLRPQTGGGTAAVVVLPQLLLPMAEPAVAVLPAQREPEPASVEHARAEPLLGLEPMLESLMRSQPAPRPEPVVRPEPVTDPEPVTGPTPVADPEPVVPHDPEYPQWAARPQAEPEPGPEPAAALPSVPSPSPAPAPQAEPLPTPARRLPQRVPRETGMRGGAAESGPEIRRRARERRGPVDAADLRRKLSGLQQGSRAGRRDAESETQGDAGRAVTSAPAAGPADTAEEATR
jgi:signal transduction histidine kinase